MSARNLHEAFCGKRSCSTRSVVGDNVRGSVKAWSAESPMELLWLSGILMNNLWCSLLQTWIISEPEKLKVQSIKGLPESALFHMQFCRLPHLHIFFPQRSRGSWHPFTNPVLTAPERQLNNYVPRWCRFRRCSLVAWLSTGSGSCSRCSLQLDPLYHNTVSFQH